MASMRCWSKNRADVRVPCDGDGYTSVAATLCPSASKGALATDASESLMYKLFRYCHRARNCCSGTTTSKVAPQPCCSHDNETQRRLNCIPQRRKITTGCTRITLRSTDQQTHPDTMNTGQQQHTCNIPEVSLYEDIVRPSPSKSVS